MLKGIFIDRIGGFSMSDLYNELLKNSIDREADAFVDRNKKYLDKSKEAVSRERNNSYFS